MALDNFASIWQIYIDVIAGLTRNPWWLTQSAAPVTWIPGRARDVGLCHCGLDPLLTGEEFSLSAQAVDGVG
jgi:hypothetical protein